jgi:hypothetical protein
MRRPALALLLAAAACGGDDTAPAVDSGVDAAAIPPTADVTRDVVATGLTIDLTAMTGTAVIELGASTGPGASLEVGDLDIRAVRAGDVDVPFARTGAQLDLGVAAAPTTITIDYAWRLPRRLRRRRRRRLHADLAVLLRQPVPVPVAARRRQPLHAGDHQPAGRPDRGLPGELTTSRRPISSRGRSAPTCARRSVAPPPAPRSCVELSERGHRGRRGTAPSTSRGLRLARAATSGPYRFGAEVGSVSAHWGAGAYGGMEHHPLWHVAVRRARRRERPRPRGRPRLVRRRDPPRVLGRLRPVGGRGHLLRGAR